VSVGLRWFAYAVEHYGKGRWPPGAFDLAHDPRQSALHASSDIFLKNGVPQSILDQWMSAVSYGGENFLCICVYRSLILLLELTSQKYRLYLRMRVAWGRRKGPPGSLGDDDSVVLSSQTPPAHTPQSESEDPSKRGLRPVEVYTSQAEALRAKEARTMTRPVQPVPFISQLAKGKNVSM